MRMLPGLPSCLLGRVLLLLCVAIIPLLPAAPAPAQTLPATWRATGIRIPETYQALCVDALQPETVLLAVAGTGTVAYNWRTGARTVVNPRPFDQCLDSGLLLAHDPAGPLVSFSTAAPAARLVARAPTYRTEDGTPQAYAITKGQTEFWASPDGGQTWQPRSFPAARITAVVVAQADARVIYALYTSRDYTGCYPDQASIDYTVYASEDSGFTWEIRTTGTIKPESGVFKSVGLEPLPGVGVPRDTVIRTVLSGGCASNHGSKTFLLSTDGGRRFEEVGIATQNSGGGTYLHLMHTGAGLLRWHGDTYATDRHLEFQPTGQPVWYDVTPPLPRPQYNPWGDADLRVFPAAPNLVFWGTWGSQWYSVDGGQHWQPWTGTLGFGTPSPYLPLTLVAVHDGQLYVRDVPEALGSQATPTTPTGAPDSTYFPATGHNLGGVFGRYWAAHGGLAQFGYPLTEPFPAISPTDGQIYRVQYFERNRLEWHPAAAGTPDEVQLGLLGAESSQARRAAGDPAFAPVPDPHTPGVDYFAPVSHTLRGAFRATWESQGGLPLYGYPLSEEFVEPGEDGRGYTVQYFERAIMERHPENAPPYDVLLRRLGATAFAQQAAAPTAPAPLARTTDLRGVALAAPGDGWAVGQETTHYADGTTSRRGIFLHYDGLTWRPAPAAALAADLADRPLNGVARATPDDGWAVGAGMVLHYMGGQWRAAISESDLRLVAALDEDDPHAVAALTANQAWIVSAGAIVRCVDHWCGQEGTTGGAALADIAVLMPGPPVAPAVGWAVGAGGTVMRFTADARNYPTWELVPGPVTADLTGVSLLSADEGWAVGAGGTILHYQAGQWTRAPSPTTADLLRVRVVSPSEAWAVGVAGTILHYSGGAWWTVPSPTSVTLRDLAFAGPDDGWAVGDSGTILRYQQGAWRPSGP